MNLRDYQSEDVGKIFDEWKEHRSTLYVAATGLGKTRVMTEIAKMVQPKRTLLLAHRDELITQAFKAFERIGIHCEIEKAELQASTSLFHRSPVVLASVQTLLSGDDEYRRMQKFDPNDFGLLLYDESHHSVSIGNRKIVEYFQRNPNLKVLGVTATPDRADEEALGQIFESVAAERDILWAIQNGWLVDIEQLFVPIRGLDFSHVRTTAGDLNGADLAAIMESESSIQGVVQPTLECAFRLPPSTLAGVPVDDWHEFLMDADEKRTLPRRRFIVFTASVAQAEMLHNIFNRVVPQLTGWVCGKTADDQRSQLLSDFARGNIHGVCNCGVLTEGFDNPLVDLIVMARPTKSRSLYAQMVGRATRALPGIVDAWPTVEQRIDAIRSSDKPNAMVLDFVGNSGRHKLITCCDILGGNVSDEAVERAIAKAKSSSVPVEVTKELEEAEEELRKAAEKRRLEEEARKRKVTLVAKSSFTVKRVNPFDAFDIHPTKARGWDSGKQLSEKQRALLQRQGIDPDSAPYPQMRQLLSEMFRRWNQKLATMKQCQLLKKHGYDTKNMSMEQASKLITAIANNGWKRPDALPF